MIKLGNYEESKKAQECLQKMELDAARNELVALIEKIKSSYQEDVINIEDTYRYLHNNDKDFAKKLWDEYMTESKLIDVNSFGGYFSHYNGIPSSLRIAVTRYGVGCYKDIESEKYNDNHWRHPFDIAEAIKNGEGYEYNKEQIDIMIQSAKRFIIGFPTYSKGFFERVSERKV